MLSSLSAGVPDSKIACAVTDLARQAYPPFLFNHCVRTFWFADRLAASGLRFDRELVYIAAMLHDIGVLEPYDQGARFEVDGARAARDFLEGHVYPAEKIEVVWDAIALHADLEEIAQYKAPEVRLVTSEPLRTQVDGESKTLTHGLSGNSSKNFLASTSRTSSVRRSSKT